MPGETQRIFTDTSNFFSISSGDIIDVGNRRYLVKGEQKEARFGIEDPKFWVKNAVDLDTQERKILKLYFSETFITNLGGVKINCFRNPWKEGDILKLVQGNPSFMQGHTFTDTADNPVRVLDIVRGTNFLHYLDQFRLPHKAYFWTILPDILERLVEAFQAIGHLHRNGFRHGDIRNDHLFVNQGRRHYVWIDFDYDFELMENPFSLDLFGLGNILINAVGKGFHELYLIRNDPYMYKDLIDHLSSEDFSLLHKSRLVNLRKLYPYIPTMLNNVLLHFSSGAHVFYESVDEITEDIQGYLASI
jgi:hypothetical protein